MNITLSQSSCVRYLSKNSSCELCKQICSLDAIDITESSLTLYQDKCISCGACVGACPTEALSLPELDVANFFFEFLKSNEDAISCKTNFVCLAGLNTEYLVSLGIMKDVVLDLGYCESCDIVAKSLPQIEKNIDEANLILSSIEANTIKKEYLCLQKESYHDSEETRREFFNIFKLKNLAKAKKSFEKSVDALENPTQKISTLSAQALREKKIPQKRKLLWTLLKRKQKPSKYINLYEDEISFTSTKVIDDSCDNCSICYRVCPTSALSSDSKFSKIIFDDMMCVKCKLCHDVCEKDSIMIDKFSTQEFFEPKEKVLIKFEVTRCDECGNLFTYEGGERICRRCKIEEEEAKNLWNIN